MIAHREGSLNRYEHHVGQHRRQSAKLAATSLVPCAIKQMRRPNPTNYTVCPGVILDPLFSEVQDAIQNLNTFETGIGEAAIPF
jgi:hypothetical protein